MKSYDVIADRDTRYPVLQETKIKYKDKVCINDSKSVVQALNNTFAAEQRCEERTWLLCFNAKLQAVGAFEVGVGGLDTCLIDLRQVFVRALLCGANSIIFAHNHPSGNSKPSSEDINLTKRLAEAGHLLNIKLLDHLIIGCDNYTSLKEMGYV